MEKITNNDPESESFKNRFNDLDQFQFQTQLGLCLREKKVFSGRNIHICYNFKVALNVAEPLCLLLLNFFDKMLIIIFMSSIGIYRDNNLNFSHSIDSKYISTLEN